MAIRVMVRFESDAEALASGRDIKIVRDHHLHREGVRHAADCPWFKSGRPDGEDKELTKECTRCEKVGPLYMETTHKGLVVATGEHNHRDDSDFYAIIWSTSKGCPVEITYATTRAWTYPNSACVDAPPEIMAAFNEWKLEEYEGRRRAADIAQAQVALKGRKVRVKGGKWAGRSGIVFYREERKSKYGTWSYGFRLGISPSGVRDSSGYLDAIWVDEKLVEVEWQLYLKDAVSAELLLESVGE